MDAGKPYMWAIDTTAGAGAGPEQLAALVAVMTRCLAPEAADRPTSATLVTALSQMKAGGPVTLTALPPAPMPAPPPAPAPVPAVDPAAPTVPVLPVGTCISYDVLPIDVIEAQGIDAGVVSAVGDAIGHLGTSTLDILKTCGGPARMVMNLQSAVPGEAGTGTGTAGSVPAPMNVLALADAMEAERQRVAEEVEKMRLAEAQVQLRSPVGSSLHCCCQCR